MLTPQEIQDQKFEKAVFGGYDMGQIDKFLDAVLSDYSSLYKENAALKAKLKEQDAYILRAENVR